MIRKTHTSVDWQLQCCRALNHVTSPGMWQFANNGSGVRAPSTELRCENCWSRFVLGSSLKRSAILIVVWRSYLWQMNHQAQAQTHVHSCHNSELDCSLSAVMRATGRPVYRSPAPQRALERARKLGPSWPRNRYLTECACASLGSSSLNQQYLVK